MSEKNKHNGIISFWKFMFSIMIVIFHTKIFAISGENPILSSGYVGVEFFFLVSGYLMTKNALTKDYNDENIGKETFDFIKRKLKNIFPYMLIAFIIELILKTIEYNYGANQIANSIWQLMFVQISGIKSTQIVTPSWYISAMLVSMFILYPLIRKYKQNFIYGVAPLIVILIGGWISHTYGNLNLTANQWTGIVCAGLLRAFFELSLGSILYEIVDKIKELNFTKFGTIILELLGTGGFILIFFITNIDKASDKYSFIMLIILSISVIIAFSEKQYYSSKILNNKLFYYLETLSLPIYLNHRWIMIVVDNLFNNFSYLQKLEITVGLTMLVSVVIVFLIKQLKKNQKIKTVKSLILYTHTQINHLLGEMTRYNAII